MPPGMAPGAPATLRLRRRRRQVAGYFYRCACGTHPSARCTRA